MAEVTGMTPDKIAQEITNVKSYVDGGLSEKADKTQVTSDLSKKADKTQVTSDLSKKADKTYVDSLSPLKSFVGRGFPEGVITAPVGTIYTDTAATAGAIRWIKTSGTGDTGWKVERGSTGQRVIAHNGVGGTLQIQRTENTVTFGLNEITLEGSAAFILFAVPYGFRPLDRISLITHNPHWLDVPSVWGSYNGLASNFSWLRKMDGSYDRPTVPTSGTVTFFTDDPWPTTLPGTPA